MSYQEHKISAKSIVARCAIVTLSDTRTLETDTGGKRIADLLRDDGQTIVEHRVIPDDAPGFGELFRMLSWNQIASGAILSRATAGIAHGKAIFSMPGSPAAVDLAMTKLILPELRHILHEIRK